PSVFDSLSSSSRCASSAWHHGSHTDFHKCPGHHRYLHSFPTRRSSDLFLAAAFAVEVVPGEGAGRAHELVRHGGERQRVARADIDRKSTRLNSSHVKISYAVFCLKKKRITFRCNLSR